MIERYGVRELLPMEYRAFPTDGPPDGEILDGKVAREIARAQRIIEGQNSKIRLALRKFSLIVELDRRYVRQVRDDALICGRLPENIEATLPSIATPSDRLEGEASDAAERMAAMRPALVQAFLSRLDSAWADHLALAEDVREGIGLVRYGSKNPDREYASILADAFEQSMSLLEADCQTDCEAILVKGSERPAARPVPSSPCSTWTYVIEDDTLPGFKVGTVAGAAAMIFESFTLPMIFVKRIAAGLAALVSRFVGRGKRGSG
jgi:preprotein translocase subunit SecA